MTSTLPPIVQAVSGAIGSAASNALIYPLDLITTRIQLENRDNGKTQKTSGLRRAFEILSLILRRDGPDALYDGIGADTCANLLSNFFYFYFYSFLRSAITTRQICLGSGRLKVQKRAHIYKPSMLEEIVLGFIAGVASRAVSMPLNIVTLRLQTEREENDRDSDSESDGEADEKKPGLVGAFRAIYKEQGLAGFWRGFKLSVILSLNPSLSLAFFQLFRRISRLHRAESATASVNPTPREAFIGGAISNSIAVTVLYPLLLAKTRLQASASTSIHRVLVDTFYGDYSTRRNPRLPFKDTGGSLSNLYQGLLVHVLKGFIGQGSTFFVKNRIEQFVVQAYMRRRQ